jgi:hypothetical protein
MKVFRLRSDVLLEASCTEDALLLIADYLINLSQGEKPDELFFDGYMELGLIQRDS